MGTAQQASDLTSPKEWASLERGETQVCSANLLCGSSQVTAPPWVSVSSLVKGDHSSILPVYHRCVFT